MAKAKTESTTPAVAPDVVIKNYPEALVKERVSKKNGSKFRTLAFRFRDDWASVILSPDCVSSVSENKVNVNLGKADDIKIASIADNGNYRSQAFFVSSIRNLIASNKAEYLKSVAI